MSDWWTPGGGFDEFDDFEDIESGKCKHWECPYQSCVCHEAHDPESERATFNNPKFCMKYLDV